LARQKRLIYALEDTTNTKWLECRKAFNSSIQNNCVHSLKGGGGGGREKKARATKRKCPKCKRWNPSSKRCTFLKCKGGKLLNVKTCNCVQKCHPNYKRTKDKCIPKQYKKRKSPSKRKKRKSPSKRKKRKQKTKSMKNNVLYKPVYNSGRLVGYRLSAAGYMSKGGGMLGDVRDILQKNKEYVPKVLKRDINRRVYWAPIRY